MAAIKEVVTIDELIERMDVGDGMILLKSSEGWLIATTVNENGWTDARSGPTMDATTNSRPVEIKLDWSIVAAALTSAINRARGDRRKAK